MIDIEKLKDEIVERLKPLEPDKIILFVPMESRKMKNLVKSKAR